MSDQNDRSGRFLALVHSTGTKQVKTPMASYASGSGSGGGDGDMLEELKRQVAQLETNMTVLQKTTATKEDLHREINIATSKFVGWMFVIFGFYTAVIAAMKFMA